MKRKLVQQGKHCLMAAIPKKWLTQKGLKKGDYVQIELLDNYLLVSAEPYVKDKKISIPIKNAERISVIRLIQMVYDAGYKEVTFSYSDKKILTFITEVVGMIEGYKIRKASDKSCTLESLNYNFDLENAFRRLFLHTKELFSLFSQSKIEEININISIVLNSAMEIKRNINTSQMPLEYKYYYFIAIQLEEIAEHFLYLLRSGEKPKLTLLNKVKKLFDDTYKNFYKFDLNWVIQPRERIWMWFGKDDYHLRAISERIKNIIKYTMGIRVK